MCWSDGAGSVLGHKLVIQYLPTQPRPGKAALLRGGSCGRGRHGELDGLGDTPLLPKLKVVRGFGCLLYLQGLFYSLSLSLAKASDAEWRRE